MEKKIEPRDGSLRDRVIGLSGDLPYTIVGHTSLPQEFAATFTKEGLEILLNELEPGDRLQVIFHMGGKPDRFFIIKAAK